MRRTQALAAVAISFMSAPDEAHWGYELSRKSGVRSGVLYPILARMLAAKWLSDGWEERDSGESGRPPRRYYELTDLGRLELGAIASEAAQKPVRYGVRKIGMAT